MDRAGKGAALHRSTPPGHISSAHRKGKDGAKVRIRKKRMRRRARERQEKRENN